MIDNVERAENEQVNRPVSKPKRFTFKKVVSGILTGVLASTVGGTPVEGRVNERVNNPQKANSSETYICVTDAENSTKTVEGNFDPNQGVDRVAGTDDQFVAIGEDGVGYLIGDSGRIIFQNGKVQLHGGDYVNGKLVNPETWELSSSLPGGDGKTPPRASGRIGVHDGLICE